MPECVFNDLAEAIEQNDTLTQFNFRRKLGEWVARSTFDNVCEFRPFPDTLLKNEFTNNVYNAMEKNLSILKTDVYSDTGPQTQRYGSMQNLESSNFCLNFLPNLSDQSLFLAPGNERAKFTRVEDFTRRNARYTWNLVSKRLFEFAETKKMFHKSVEEIVDLFDFQEYSKQQIDHSIVDKFVIVAPLESFSRHNRTKKFELLQAIAAAAGNSAPVAAM